MMRLLQLRNGELTLSNHSPGEVPKYAILSHTWGPDKEEVTLQDLMQKQGKDKKGYEKLKFCGQQAKRDNLDYFWVDTCCIDKTNHTELSRAINSMFRWYQEATHCYVFLPDVSAQSKDSSGSWEPQFRRSRWHTRGWTLQELLAPASVKFYSVEGVFLGDKTEMVDVIHDITKIKVPALRGAPLAQFPVHERMNWSRRRQTKEAEDLAYCLFGIFDVFIPLIYGEGEQNAMSRLEEAIEKRTGGPRNPNPPVPTQASHLVIPFGQNEDFVGRENILFQLVQRILPSARKFDCQRTVLEGLGGVGKTQIALEAAYRVHEQDSTCSIFWVPAISMIVFESAYREIGRVLGIPNLDDGQTDVKTQVKLAIEQSTTEWLLIVDNIDDISLLTRDSLQEYLPFHRNGSIFFTTRNHEVAVQLDVPPKHIYAIEEMSEVEALKLLQNNLKPRQHQDCPEATRDLVQHLVYLPLAIKQASAYLSKTGETTEAYLGYCLASDDAQMELLNMEFENRWRYSKNTNPITKTWLISFQHLEQSYPLAVEYLKFICFLAEKDIPISLLPPGDSKRAKAEAIGVMEGYAFISLREGAQSFDIHRLVRLASRNWIKTEWEMRCSKAIHHVRRSYPTPQHENRQLWLGYLSHAQTILIEHNYCTDKADVAFLSCHVGRSYQALGRYKDEDEMYQRAIVLLTPIKKQKMNVMYFMLCSATSLMSRARYQEAEDILRRLLTSEEAVQRMGDYFLHNLANVLDLQGKYQAAGEIYQQVLENELSKHGQDDPLTLTAMNNIALNLVNQEKLSEAEDLFRLTLKQRTSVIGPDHPHTMGTSNGLAWTLNRLGRDSEAENIFREVLQRYTKVLGPEHPDTLYSSRNLGYALSKQGKHLEAEIFLRQTLDIETRVLGARQPGTLSTMTVLAMVLKGQGRNDESKAMYQETFRLRKLVLGPEHPDTLDLVEFIEEFDRVGIEKRPEIEKRPDFEESDDEDGGVVL